MAGQSDLYRTGISITQDFLWDFYQDLLSGLAIAVVIHSVDLLHYAHGVGTGIKLQHGELTLPIQIDRLNSYGFLSRGMYYRTGISIALRSLSRSLSTRLILSSRLIYPLV